MKKIYLSLIAISFAVNFSYAQWTGGPTGPVYYNGGSVGIGTSSPAYALDVNGFISTNNRFYASHNGSDVVGIGPLLQLQNATGTTYGQAIQLSSIGNLDIWGYNNIAGGWTNNLTVAATGNVGIGTNIPAGLLSLKNQIPITSNSDNPLNYAATSGVVGQTVINSYYVLNSDGSGPYPRYLDIASVGSPDGTNGGGNIRFLTNPITTNSLAVERMRVSSNGNILIGQTSQVNTAYKLDVAGHVRANEIVVNTTGADFVFEPTYKLPSISSVEKYIAKNHHLPEIPSAKQMQEDGLSVGENQVKLLQKVEELTLYLIEKDKQITDQNKKIENQQVVNESLQEQIDQLAKKLNN